MSCWRRQTVLRLPYPVVGLDHDWEIEAFQEKHEDGLNWDEGCFAPSLSERGEYRFLDYILRDEYPVRTHNGSDWRARALTPAEREQYLPVFRTLFPRFTMEQMNAVHHCTVLWYDGTDQPYCYDLGEE